MVVDTRIELTSEKLYDMGEERVRGFNKKWGTSVMPSVSPDKEPKNTKSEPLWWENNIKNHLFEGREIKSPVLRSLYQEYLDEYFGVKDEADLKKVFTKNMDKFGGSEDDEEKAFGDYLFNNFSDWIKGKPTIARAREEIVKADKKYDLTVNNEIRSGLNPRLKSELDKFLTISKSGEVFEFSIAIHDGAIDNVGLIRNGGAEASLPLKDFMKVFSELEEFKIESSGKSVGFRFGKNGDYIFPGTPEYVAKRILSKMKIEGKKLNSNFIVTKIPFDETPQDI